MLLVPFTSDPAQRFTTDLGGQKLVFEARYNTRSESWTFDVTRDLDRVMLAAGVPLLVGQDLLAPYALKLGILFAVDLSKQGLDAGPEDLGDRVIVVWMDPTETFS